MKLIYIWILSFLLLGCGPYSEKGSSIDVPNQRSKNISTLDKTVILDPTRPYANINLHDSTPAGLYYEWVKDDFVSHDERVLELHSHGIENSFHIVGYDTDEKYEWKDFPSYQGKNWISWDSKFSNDFIIYVVLNFTTKSGKSEQKDIVYTPSKHGYEDYTDTDHLMHFYLGADAKDGKWHHYRRNIMDDFHHYYPEASLSYAEGTGNVNGIAIRGSGRITNLMLSRH